MGETSSAARGDAEVDWEAVLALEGMPAELPTEVQVAAEAGVEIVAPEYADDGEAEALAEKLSEEDPRNKFGGFPNSLGVAVNLAQTLRGEWAAEGVQPEEIKIFIHPSCINGHDCLTMYHAGGNVYHYNTKNIVKYSRKILLDRLRQSGFAYVGDK